MWLSSLYSVYLKLHCSARNGAGASLSPGCGQRTSGVDRLSSFAFRAYVVHRSGGSQHASSSERMNMKLANIHSVFCFNFGHCLGAEPSTTIASGDLRNANKLPASQKPRSGPQWLSVTGKAIRHRRQGRSITRSLSSWRC